MRNNNTSPVRSLRILVLAILIASVLTSGISFAGTPVLYNYNPSTQSVEIYSKAIILWHNDPRLGFDYFYVDEDTVGQVVFDRWLAVMLTATSMGKPFALSYDPDGNGEILSVYAPK